PPEVEARLFAPFFTTKPVGQGTGLGLSICMGIIEGHGGRLTVQGRPGQGAIFRAELPLGAPATPAVVEGDGPVGRPRRILVVDDEAEMADVMSEILSRDGHEVETASNGVEALARLQGARWDLVVSDIKMPKMDGPALWAAVEATDPDLARRFVFFTGDTLGSGTAKFLEQTGAPSIRKPFTLRDVRAALAKVPDAAKR